MSMAAAEVKDKPPAEAVKNYKGFVAGVFSGISKLSGKLLPFLSEFLPNWPRKHPFKTHS